MLALDARFTPAPPATHRVLSLESDAADAPALLERIQTAGGWARCVKALAEDLETMMLIESTTVRFRHRGTAGFAAWHDGRTAGVCLIRPYAQRMTLEALEIMFGFKVIEYAFCPRCRVRTRLTQSGTPRAHKTPQGGKCA